MRDPNHETIQVVVNASQADQLERLFAPYLTLAMMPKEMQDGDGALPVYFFAITNEGMEYADYIRLEGE